MTVEFDRRRHTRQPARMHHLQFGRIRPGTDVSIIDVSAGGMQVEADRRLLPGTRVELHLRSEQHHREVIRGRVVRCIVARLGTSRICYQGAIMFDRPPSWIVDLQPGYSVPNPEGRPSDGCGNGLPTI